MSKRSHPKDSASFLSSFFNFWLVSFFRYTHKALKYSKKLLKSPTSLTPKASYEALESQWTLEKSQKTPNLYKVLIKVYSKQYFLSLIPLGISMAFVTSQSILIGEFISFLYQKDDLLKGYLLCVGITVFALIGTIQNDKMFLKAGELAITIRANLNELIYKKILNISQINLQTGNLTNIINLLNIDLGFFMQLCMTTYIILVPFYFLAATIILYFKIGWAGVIVHFTMLLTIPILITILNKLDVYKSKIVSFSQERMDWISGIVQGIRIIKIFCWEKVMNDKVSDSRKNEIKWYLKKSILKIISFTIVTSFQGAFILLTYFIKVEMSQSLQLNDVFCGVCILITSHFYITAGVSEGLIMMRLIKLAIARVREILLLPEIAQIEFSDKYQIQMLDVASSWSTYASSERSTEGLMSEPNVFVLRDLNFFVAPGQLYGVLGLVGSGKSTFVNTLLGECHIIEGSLLKNCKISYLSQEPWIINSTIKENILMGAEYNEERYKQVIQICELVEDLQEMLKNDESKVGEEGKLLSQGQKARVALARCVYKDSDLYLLDDPFAALDFKIAENIMQRCIKGFLANKTRVLVVNDIDLLDPEDKVLMLNSGYIEFNGAFENILYNHQSIESIRKYIEQKNKKQKIKSKLMVEAKLKQKGNPLRASQVITPTIVSKFNFNYRFSLLYQFIMEGFRTWYFFVLFVILIGSLQFFYILHQYWLSMWSGQDAADQSTSVYPLYLLILTLVIIAGTLFRNYLLYFLIHISSKNLHNKAISAVLNSNIEVFYRSTPKEFIDSFSSDIFQIDENLTQAITFTVMFGIMITGYVAYIVYVIPWNAINIFMFILYSLLVLCYCVSPIVGLRQCYMLANGPIINICKETVNGISTIRSLELKKFSLGRFQYKNEKLVTKFLNFFYFLRCYTSFISFGAAFLLSINFFFAMILIDSVSPLLVAVSLSFNIGIMNILPWFFRLIVEIITLLPSLNRVHSFTKIAPEAKQKLPDLKVTQGKIEFINVTMAYAGFRELVLSDVSFQIEAGKRFGIIGRSGSGKSSIFNAIYRLSTPAAGKIFIDDQDVALHSLTSLRKQISFLSQNPFIFSGSVKFNIDPEGVHNDFEICRLLKTVGLGDFRLMHGLQADVRGLDLSVGQKQLFALCRVLVRNCKILLLDEATANVDDETGQIMEKLINEYCSGKTLVMIAHKLKLMIDYDMVMMIDNGCVVDILPPKMVLTREHTLVNDLE